MKEELKKIPKWVMIILAIFSIAIIFLVVNIIIKNSEDLNQQIDNNLKQSEESTKQAEELTETYKDLIDDEISKFEESQIKDAVYGIMHSVMNDYAIKSMNNEEVNNCYYIDGSNFDFTNFYENTDKLKGSILINNDDITTNVWLSDGYVMITGTDDNLKITLSNEEATTTCNK